VLLKDKVVKSIKDTLKYSCSNHAAKNILIQPEFVYSHVSFLQHGEVLMKKCEIFFTIMSIERIKKVRDTPP